MPEVSEVATNSVQRSVTFNLIVPGEDKALYRKIVASINRYRAACRECYGVLLNAQAAGATIVVNDEDIRVKPENNRAKLILALAVDHAKVQVSDVPSVRGEGKQYIVTVGKAQMYELRQSFMQEIWPNCMAFVWDSLRRDVTQVWKAGDPEFPKASRGWLALQGSRNITQFNRRGIGFPRSTARPKLEGHTLTLKWDHDLGPIEFKLPRLAGSQYHVWKSLVENAEGWQLGTLYLNERDGKIIATISHTRPANSAEVDPDRVCVIHLTPDDDTVIRLVGPNGEETYETIGAEEVRAYLDKQYARRIALEKRRACAGSPNRPWGHKKGWRASQDVLSALTRQRELNLKDYNHAWTRRIVSMAIRWRCGVLKVHEVKESMYGHPWAWSQFENSLRYKGSERGIKVVFPNEKEKEENSQVEESEVES